MCLRSAQQSKVMFSFGQNQWKILIKWKLPFSLTTHFDGKCLPKPCNTLSDSPTRQILCLCVTWREWSSARLLQCFAITDQLWLICSSNLGYQLWWWTVWTGQSLVSHIPQMNSCMIVLSIYHIRWTAFDLVVKGFIYHYSPFSCAVSSLYADLWMDGFAYGKHPHSFISLHLCQ